VLHYPVEASLEDEVRKGNTTACPLLLSYRL
jgi:hypothetical protein